MRVLAGLWDADGGSVLRPAKLGAGGLFLLPQRPYLPLGSLRQCVLYPKVDERSEPNAQARSSRVVDYV